VLDAFCGTGALGLEALSRGAAHASFIDSDSQALRLARENAAGLGEAGTTSFLAADATHPPPAAEPCNLIFLDPPYAQDLAGRALAALAAAGWLAPGAIVVVETGRGETINISNSFEAVDERVYGKVKVSFYRFLKPQGLR
jgi:16S rRNA (guanine966-N2)-methyltransferase